MKHFTKNRDRADLFSTLALAMDARERLFPQAEVHACYHGAIVNGIRCHYVELWFEGKRADAAYLREERD